MAFPSKSSYFVVFALFVAVSFSNVEVGTSARQLLQLPIPAVGIVPTLPMPQLPPLPSTGAVPAFPLSPLSQPCLRSQCHRLPEELPASPFPMFPPSPPCPETRI
ncbi:hypothetical protein LINPERPRIM_LOCUS3267 [Linum perenne]